ncbi:MAG: leucine-rich repeat protein [Paludibacteraceae bacterium]
MKKQLLSLLVLLLTTLSTHAYDFQSGDLYYNITGENTVEVTYQEARSETNYQGLTTATIPEAITYENTTYSVTSIGNGAFNGCSSLTSITIPNSVTSIGIGAFNGCSSLTSITIPNSVTSIGDQAFYRCSSLTSITIPNSVTSIRESTFIECSALIAIDIPTSVTAIEKYAFEYCTALTSITIPNSVTSMDKGIFQGCSALTTAVLPNSLTSIESSVFDYCTSLTSITIPYSVKSIGSRAFRNCSSLTSLTIPNSVTSVGSRAFEDCSNIQSLTIGSFLTSIGERAFDGCSSLISLAVESGNTVYDSRDNCNAIIETETNTLILGCQSTTIPNTVTSIGNYAFDGCSSLTSILIPNSVTSIGLYAFGRCSALTSITIPNSVTSIGNDAFSGCSSLSSVTIPESVTSIGEYAFRSCSSITSISIPESVTNVGKDAFAYCSALTAVIWNAKRCVTEEYSSPFEKISSQIISFTFGKEVVSIPGYLCEGMSNLSSVTSLSCTPPICGYNVFYNTPSDLTLMVPSISMESYKNSTPWKSFTSFGKCLSVNLQSSDSVIGTAHIDQDVDCDSMAIISATSNLFTHQFTQWSDGNTDNPRTIKLTQDTTLTAEFGLAYSGKCGDDLYWAYNNKEVKITGTGAMYNYTESTMPWTLLRDSIKTVRVGNNATSIGEYAFANTPKLAELHIGANVEDIGANAFAGCTRLYDIYCYPIEPPFAKESSFANYNVYVYVPCENQRNYTLDVVWGLFKFVECIGSEDVVVTGNEVTASPSYEDVTITWPVTDGADTYSLVLTKESDTFCTLVFNAQGQLVSIAFKPARQNAPAAEGTTPATYAEQTANGFRFTVTGLDEGTDYAYTLTVRNAANSVLETYAGEFTTLSNTPTGILDTDSTHAGQVEKQLRDGKVVIIRNGVTYDVMGRKMTL